MRLVSAIVLAVCWSSGIASLVAPAQQQEKWTRPAADLAGQIADILGPGQAQLTIRNLSTIPAGDIPAIRKLLEQDLKLRGVLAGGAESANLIRVVLSQNLRERLWVAEVVEGNDTRVTMVRADNLEPAATTPAGERVVLRKGILPRLITKLGTSATDDPILAAAEINGHLLVMYADHISAFSSAGTSWVESNSFAMANKPARDPHGVLIPSPDGGSFLAYVPGTQCSGSYALPLNGDTRDSGWTVRCRASDDPWPVYQTADASNSPSLKAFYNAARDFYTGVVTPNIGTDLPPFYAAGLIPRAAGGAALLIAGIDGRVQLVENNTARVVSGTRDWGSDFAVVRSGCGAGTQVIASSSGEAENDTLRAFVIPSLDAIPESNVLAMNGTVAALWTAQDGKSAMAVVRNSAGTYEVDRVTALCN